ncbi:unnamed protein product [Caenorhabditis auriculariae]|uniref:Uncharacterized protein n=1 Tax=Caenorhabditis auriculariae TaxID=2777116 RepID=A0A8S1HPD2_9PELO|nr:unnamed protein product [Caenorhabditis auriculariae]
MRNFVLVLIVSSLLAVFSNAYIITPGFYDQRTSKKSSNYRSLASSSRNCYFSPVNCIIAQDLSSFRQMGRSGAFSTR